MKRKKIDKAMLFYEVKQFLEKRKVPYHYDKDREEFAFAADFRGMFGKMDYTIVMNENYYMIEAVCPIGINVNDDAKTFEVLKYLQMINYKFKIGVAGGDAFLRCRGSAGTGAFVLNIYTGEILMTRAVAGSELDICGDMYVNAIIMAAESFDRCGNGLKKLICNDITAEEAIKYCDFYKFFSSISNSTPDNGKKKEPSSAEDDNYVINTNLFSDDE